MLKRAQGVELFHRRGAKDAKEAQRDFEKVATYSSLRDLCGSPRFCGEKGLAGFITTYQPKKVSSLSESETNATPNVTNNVPSQRSLEIRSPRKNRAPSVLVV